MTGYDSTGVLFCQTAASTINESIITKSKGYDLLDNMHNL